MKSVLLALTPNYIGPNASHQLPNEPLVGDDNLPAVIPISGELLNPSLFKDVSHPYKVRQQRLEYLFSDPTTCLDGHQPTHVLIYVGTGLNGNISLPMKFVQVALKRCGEQQTNIVWPIDRERRHLLYREISALIGVPNVHFSPPTGNNKMHELIGEFLRNGTIRDPIS